MQEMHKMNFWLNVWERNHFHVSTEEMTWKKMNKRYGSENLSIAITNGWITLHKEKAVRFPIPMEKKLKINFTPEITRRYTIQRPEFNVSEIKELSCI